MHDVLARHGYTVIEAVDGMNALEILAREPDVVLVLTDLYMPRMDGLALLRNLRRDQKHIGLPVIIQTTEAQASAVTKARQAGATGWLIKPVGEVAVIYVPSTACSKADRRPSRIRWPFDSTNSWAVGAGCIAPPALSPLEPFLLLGLESRSPR